MGGARDVVVAPGGERASSRRGARDGPAHDALVHARSAARACGVVAAGVGGVSLALWLAGIPPRWSADGVITVKANMALAQLLAGVALVLLSGPAAPRRRLVAAALAFVVLAIGTVTLAEHVFGVDVGVDQLIATEPAGAPGTVSPNRMGPPGASTLVICSVGLLVLAVRRRAAAVFGTAAFLVVLLPLVGRLYGISPLYAVPQVTAIAWPAVVGLASLGVGLICEPRPGGPVPLLWRPDPGGILLRRTAIPVVVVPIALGFLHLLGERRGLYEHHVGTGLFVVTIVAAVLSLLWGTASRMSAAAAGRASAEEARDDAAMQFQMLADNISQLAWIADEKGAVFWYNRRWYDYTGTDLERMLGWGWKKVHHPAHVDRVVAKISRCFETGEPWEDTFPLRGKDGAYRWFLSRAFPIRDETGRVQRWFGTNTDVTAQREVEEALRTSEERYRTLFTNMTEGFALGEAILDADGGPRDFRFLEMNDSFEAQSGLGRAATLGRSMREVLPRIDQSVVDRYCAVALGGPAQRYESYNRDLDRHFTVHCFSPMPGRFAVLLSDVTDRKRSEAEVRRVAELLDLGDAFVELDGEFRFVRVNAAYEAMSHLRRDELVGRSHWELFPETARPDSTYWREYHRALRDRVPVAFDEYYAPLDLWTGVTAYPTSDGGLAMFIRDVSERKRAEEEVRRSQEKLAAALASMTDAVFIVDADGRFIDLNEACATFYRFRSKAEAARTFAEYRDLLDVFLADGTVAPVEQWAVPRALRGETATNAVYRLRRKDTGESWVGSYSFAPIRDGRGAIVGSVVVGRDITESERTQQALRDANERLRDADRRKDEFLGMLSHELRNPLAPIRNSLYILDHAAPDGQHARRAREVASRQIAHLTRLVDDLLDVTRIARGKIELRRARLDLGALARATAEDYRPVVHAHGLDLDLAVPDEPLVVDGDGTRLAQVLGNLLSNAAKFTPAGGRVTLEVRRLGRRAVVHVRDTGVGVAPELLGTIFDPFTQAKQTLARSEGGLGLGLALVKALAELHGGRVSATSGGPRGGTVFTVELPLAHPDEVAHPVDGDGGAPRRHRVLVVDDNVDAAESLADLVRLLGHEVEVAHDGPSAVERVDVVRPDFVLCDIGLPGMDGYEVARAVRAKLEGAVRLVAVSGYARPEDVDRSVAAGFDAHLAKPPDPAHLQWLFD